MKKITLLLVLVLFFKTSHSQNKFSAIIKDSETNELLIGATSVVLGTQKGATSNDEGRIEIDNIENGKQIIAFSYLGYKTRIDTIIFPLSTASDKIILLKKEDGELEEIFVSTTRSSRTIEDIPTRIEVLSGEELDEKANMKPGDIRMMLNETTGIQTQQTSATSDNSSIRIQGLDGKYTQIIRDGFPLYSGFSGGLGLLQIVPLDLKQVEIIKGSSSTLYGGGAIAGLVNLISKTPSEKRELNFMLNATSALGLDVSGFYSKKFNKVGTSMFASYNHATAYDPADIGLTAIPEYSRFTINPKIFFYPSKQSLISFGVNATHENRIGGDIKYIEGSGDSIHSYFERNITDRYSTQLSAENNWNANATIRFKNSFSYYNRSIEIPDYIFSGVQLSSYSELNFNINKEKSDWACGINFITDKFIQDNNNTINSLSYNEKTIGAFIQNTLSVSQLLTLETGLRGDYQNIYGGFLLPRISMLYKMNNHFTTRLGGGLGYKTPTVFTEDAERIQFKNVLPIDEQNTEAEKSTGVNFDFNYRTTFFNHKISFSINLLFFYTHINHPLVFTSDSSGYYSFLQPSGFIDTKGIETNVKLTYHHFKLFLGYTFADVKQHYETTTQFPLVAKNRLNSVLIYEVEDELKIGLEAYYFSPQQLNDGATGKSYWITGLMVEKLWEHFSLFINFENFTNTMQTNFDSIYTGSITNPVFRDIYAPVDGFVVNGGIKLRL